LAFILSAGHSPATAADAMAADPASVKASVRPRKSTREFPLNISWSPLLLPRSRMDGPAMSFSIVEGASLRKCPVALVSIARRYV
jgi:hypothetical protein